MLFFGIIEGMHVADQQQTGQQAAAIAGARVRACRIFARGLGGATAPARKKEATLSTSVASSWTSKSQ
jgi:hypothetical protein